MAIERKPVLVRFHPALLERVEMWAKSKSVSRAEAIGLLIASGLDGKSDGSGKAGRAYDRSARRSASAPRKDAEDQSSTQPPELKRSSAVGVSPEDVAAAFAAFQARKKDKP